MTVYLATILSLALLAAGLLLNAAAMTESHNRLPWWWIALAGDTIAIAMLAYVVGRPFNQPAAIIAAAAACGWLGYVAYAMRQHRVTAVRQQINEDAL